MIVAPSSVVPLISIVVPVFNEQANIGPMHAALSDMAAGQTAYAFEFLFVDDGSLDQTFDLLCGLHVQDSRIKIVRLSRNYGSHTAAAAGLSYSSGEAAMIMAGDLQDHPSEIPRFIERWRAGFHVVLGVRETRDDSPVDRFLARCFAIFVRYMALPNYPLAGTGSFCLVDRKVINALCSFSERNRMTFGLILYSGFRQVFIPYSRRGRQSGSSKWSLRRKLRMVVDTVVSFSHTPIRAASICGSLIALGSIFYATYLALDRLIYGSEVPGWTSTVVVILLLSGLQLTVLGMLGEYIWRALDDVRRRPLFFVQDEVGEFPRLSEEVRQPGTLRS